MIRHRCLWFFSVYAAMLVSLGLSAGAAAPETPPLPPPTRTDTCEFVGGVPLGGIGTGTVELRGDGSFREWQIFNNWGNTQNCQLFKHAPSYDLLNAFAAVKVDGAAYLLETHPPQGLPGVAKITYAGWFPFSHLQYDLSNASPVQLSVEAFGAYVPHHPSDSGIPALGLTYRFQNTTGKPVKISLALSVVNPFGQKCRRETFGKRQIAESLQGNAGVALAALDEPAVGITGGPDTADSLKAFWDGFSRAQPLSSSDSGQRAAQVVTFTLRPHAERSERFVVGWYFPDHYENGSGILVGHKYEAWTSSPAESVTLLADRFDSLRAASARWRDTLRDSSWPLWVNHWLCNNQNTLTKYTWWTKDGRFLTYESPECPNGSPAHIIDLADWPVVDEFPELELRLLRQYAASQNAQGAIPEEFQFNGTQPSATIPGGRDLIDINPKYAVEVYHRWRETGDKAFLDATWPAVKRAIVYNQKFDTMGVGLPSGPDLSSTWDHWNDRYLFSYGASVELAGLKASEALARAENDPAFAAQMRARYETGLASMNAHLWNGEFYGMTTDQNLAQDNLCFVESTYGDVLGRLVGLGPILPDDRSLSSLRAIAKYNNQPTQWGLVVSADMSGRMVEYSGDKRSQITICHAIPAPIGLIQEGNEQDIANGLRILKQLYDIGGKQPGGLWNLPHHVIAATGDENVDDFPHYMRDRSLWALLKALNGWSYDAPDQSLAVGPVLNPENCRGPWICSAAYGTLAQEVAGRRQTVSLEGKDGTLILRALTLRSRLGAAKSVTAFLNQKPLSTQFTQNGALITVKFEKLMSLQTGGTLKLVLAGNHH